MPDPIIVPKSSVLNLDIEGSVGSFCVKNHSGSNSSIEVKYILSTVGLDLSGGHEEKLLSNLKPIREVFMQETLSFDEIMQRDIDDQRVSLDLVSYLLEEGKKGLVKLFPPIVIVVVPIKEGSNGPATKYPHVTTYPKTKIGDYEYKVIRSGEVGGEAFEFRQMYQHGELSDHNYAKLRLNTDKNKLAIVDGQHRAMALLSLYRNIKGWPDGTTGYKSYYQRWTKEIIQEKDLTNLRLPVMICVFPELDSSNKELIKVTEACRAIFLSLNKNAKPVTRARNILLNDRDLIAEFLRDTLSIVKNRDEQASILRLHNIQFDADTDKTALTSEMATTGVMHLYSLIERLMLTSNQISGFPGGWSRLDKVKDMGASFKRDRLNAKDIIGSDLANDTNRQNYLEDTKEQLVKEFHDRYSKNIIYCLEEFYPIRTHAEATRKIKSQVKSKSDAQAKAILFDNQGAEDVFKEFRDRVVAEIKELADYSRPVPQGLKDSKDESDSTYSRVLEYKKSFTEMRANQFFGKKVCNTLISASRGMFDNNFNTSAFQNALLLTFYNIMEDYQGNPLDKRLNNDEIFDYLKEYIASINTFFAIKNDNDIKRVCRVFFGQHKGKFNTEEMKFQDNAACLRDILIPGELNPNEWIKFRFILLELWHTKNEDLNSMIVSELDKCRILLYKKYCKRKIAEQCIVDRRDEEDMPLSAKKSIYKKCKLTIVSEINSLESNRQITDDSIFEV